MESQIRTPKSRIIKLDDYSKSRWVYARNKQIWILTTNLNCFGWILFIPTLINIIINISNAIDYDIWLLGIPIIGHLIFPISKGRKRPSQNGPKPNHGLWLFQAHFRRFQSPGPMISWFVQPNGSVGAFLKWPNTRRILMQIIVY